MRALPSIEILTNKSRSCKEYELKLSHVQVVFLAAEGWRLACSYGRASYSAFLVLQLTGDPAKGDLLQAVAGADLPVPLNYITTWSQRRAQMRSLAHLSQEEVSSLFLLAPSIQDKKIPRWSAHQ
jgi:hypothetical protein